MAFEQSIRQIETICWRDVLGERNENRDHQWAESQRKHLEHRQFADPENCRRKRDQGILSSKRFESLLCWLLCLPGSEGALPLLDGKRTDFAGYAKGGPFDFLPVRTTV